jgi:hypothetical protein
MKKLFVRALSLWLPLLVAITGLFGFGYVAVQQNYRQSANDPQIQMAEDAAVLMSKNHFNTDLIFEPGVPTTDIRQGLTPWIAIYDAGGANYGSTGLLNGDNPKMPTGLLDYSTWLSHKTWHSPTGLETRVTWQPESDIRQALVIVHFDSSLGGGYAVAGRSMRTTEERIISLTQLAAIAWSFTVLATYAAIFVLLVLGWL